MTKHDDFFKTYFDEYKMLTFSSEIQATIKTFAAEVHKIRDKGTKMIFAGNGASASLAEHGAVDFTKQGNVRGITFHDPNLITCFSNDFGYDHWISKAIEYYADDGDVVVLISVSGESRSVIEAARTARARGLKVVAFTGRTEGNQLGQLADIHFHVASDAYNIVENIHGIWLTATVDYVIGKSVYETRATISH